MTVTCLGEYGTVREALNDARADGDRTYYAPNYDIYVRVIHDRPGVWVHHLVQKWDVDCAFWTWQEMREVH